MLARVDHDAGANDTAFGVATAAAHHGGVYVNDSTSIELAGPFNVWSVTASFGYRYNRYHVYQRWVDAARLFGWGYEVIVSWCGNVFRIGRSATPASR